MHVRFLFLFFFFMSETHRHAALQFFFTTLLAISADIADLGVSGRLAIATTLGNHALPSKPVHAVDENT